MQQSDNRKILIIGVASALFILMVVSILFQLGLFSRPPASGGRDFRGNAVAPETSLKPTAATFVGFDNLLENGVTLDQVYGLQTGFQRYQPFSPANTVIDISGGTLTPIAAQQDHQNRPSISTTVLVNGKTTYPIKFYYWGTSQVELLIYSADGKALLFDSGTITGQS